MCWKLTAIGVVSCRGELDVCEMDSNWLKSSSLVEAKSSSLLLKSSSLFITRVEEISTLVKEFLTLLEEFISVHNFCGRDQHACWIGVALSTVGSSICEHVAGQGESRIVVPMGSGTVQGLLERVKRRVGSNE